MVTIIADKQIYLETSRRSAKEPLTDFLSAPLEFALEDLQTINISNYYCYRLYCYNSFGAIHSTIMIRIIGRITIIGDITTTENIVIIRNTTITGSITIIAIIGDITIIGVITVIVYITIIL